jgi:O-antigen ligase/xanthosine utilization system XapX-like protein
MSIEKVLIYRISQLVLFVGPMTVYVVSPSANYDAISLPKMLSISSVGFLILTLILSRWNYMRERMGGTLASLCISFISFMFLTLLFSGAPLGQQIWGSFGRNTGFVTYTSLLLILVGTALIQDPQYYAKLVKVFVLSSIPVLVYCFIQMSGNDPIGWSEKRTFATFGNVNFLSAYLGMIGISCLAMVLSDQVEGYLRITSLAIVFCSIPIILSTDSIQGLMVMLAGGYVVLGMFLNSILNSKVWLLPFGFLGIGSLISVIFALFNKGFLAPLIFQTSIVLRGDYMHAGFAMTLLRPFLGVGLDSYGDWYREVRGVLTTNRGSADRISNSAHNIFLDISSNGGFPLLVLYVAFVVLAFLGSLRLLRKSEEFNPFFAAIFATWIGYQVQALISINQIAVGIWGWIFTGALLGLYKSLINGQQLEASNTRSDQIGKSQKNLSHRSMNRKLRATLLPPQITLLGLLGFSVGAILSIIPLTADIAYKKASQTMAIDQMYKSTQRLGSTAFHRELVLEAALKSNLTAQAGEIALSLVGEYPRDFYGWKILALISPVGSPERSRAVDMLVSLDPFNRQSIPSK